MSDVGFKTSLPGIDVQKATESQLSVSSKYPILKCDLRSNPKHYGTIYFTLSPLAPGASVTMYKISHGYNYIPSYLTQWNVPVGTDSLATSGNATYGIGDIDMALNGGVYITMYTDNSNFYIIAKNNSGATSSAFGGTIRFYIFADDFSGS